MKKLTLQFALLLFATFFAQTVIAKCQVIDRVPATITKSGNYCLNQTLESQQDSGPAILVLANNVNLNLRGHSLSNRLASDGFCLNANADDPTIGIQVVAATNVRIRNGQLHCFRTGVRINGSDPNCNDCSYGNSVQNLTVNTSYAKGIFVRGSQTVIKNNHIVNTGGARETVPAGIHMIGSGNTVKNNDVMDVRGRNATGIITAVGFANLVVNNRVQQSEYGFRLFGGNAVRYRDNLTAGVDFAYFGQGQDLGNND